MEKGPVDRELAPRLQAAIAMAGALRDRGMPESAASVAAELGALAFKQAYATWVETDEDQGLAEASRAALDRLRASVAALGWRTARPTATGCHMS